MTSDTPVASKLAPSSLGGCAVAEAGNLPPITCEKLMPACSNTAPSRSTRDSPPPPSGRCQLSWRNVAPPSACCRAAVMRSCRSRRYAMTTDVDGVPVLIPTSSGDFLRGCLLLCGGLLFRRRLLLDHSLLLRLRGGFGVGRLRGRLARGLRGCLATPAIRAALRS